MVNRKDEDILSFGVAVDIRDSLKAIERFHKEWVGTLKKIAAANEQLSKGSIAMSRRVVKAQEDHTQAIGDATEAYEDEQEAVEALGDAVEGLTEKTRKYTEEEKKAHRERMAALREAKKAKKDQERLVGLGGGDSGILDPGGSVSRKTPRAKKPAPFFDKKRIQAIKEGMRSAGEALRDPLQSFLSRDAKGLIEGSLRGLGRGLTPLGGMAGRRASKWGRSLYKTGRRQEKAGGSKMMAKSLQTLGKSLTVLSKIGPLLGTLGGALIGILKLFVDADAQVKDFNKSIMQSTSNLELMGASGSRSAHNLKGALEGVRAAAEDYEFNNRLGISPEQHQQVINVLNQEGVALGNLWKQAGETKEGMSALTQSIVASGVAYSRALGVPLQEINQLQAEMVTEMGASLETTTDAYAKMTRAAQDSGIAGNKFFQMIRGMSQDLSIWNLRMDDSVALLGKLGKVMSPRNAQKFMQEMASGMKNMGRSEKLKTALFTGQKETIDIVQRDIARKTAHMAEKLAKEVGGDSTEIQGLLETKGLAGVRGLVDQLPQEMRGAVTDSILDLDLQRKQSSKGFYGAAMATADLGIGGVLEMREKSLLKMTGHKTLADGLGSLDMESIAEGLGVSDAEAKQFTKVALAIESQREALIEQGKSADEVAKMGYDQIIETMTDDLKHSIGADKDGKDHNTKMFELSQKQGELTQSLTEKLENLVTWFMGKFYNLMLSIWDAISSIPGVGKSAQERQAQKAVLSSRSTALDEAFETATAGGSFDFGAFKGAAASGPLVSALMSKLGSEGGVASVGAAVDKNFNRNELLAMAKASGASDEQMDKLRRAGHKAGSIQALQHAGLDPKKVFEKALWSPDSASALAGFVDDSGIGGGGAGRAAPKAAAATVDTAEQAEVTNEKLTAIQTGSDKQLSVLKDKGIKLDKGFLKGDFARENENSMLSALRTALFEYYMYKDSDKSLVASAFGKAGSISAGAGYIGKAALAKGFAGPEATLTQIAALQGNSQGGTVTGIANGVAVVAAHGEGLASVGRGERIVPAGGGGENISIAVNGVGGQDLANVIKGKVVEGIREWKRREKLS